MSGWLPCGVTDADIDRTIEDEGRPCKWDLMDGVCFVCGAGPDDECVIEQERRDVRRFVAEALKAWTLAPGDTIGPDDECVIEQERRDVRR